MVELLARTRTRLASMAGRSLIWVVALQQRIIKPVEREEGQTTAEYALVILAAAAVAVVLIAWAQSTGKLPAFFDKIIDDISGNA